MRRLVLCLCLLAGCGSNPFGPFGPYDFGPLPDAGAPPDLRPAGDLALPPSDLALAPSDMTSPPPTDFAMAPADLSMTPPSDLAMPPRDLSPRQLALRVEQVPSNIVSGNPFSLRVDVVDATTGALVTGVYPEISLKLGAATNPKGVLSGAMPKQPSSGVAELDGLSIDRWGQYTVIATSPGLASGESTSFRVQGSRVAFIVQPTTTAAHQVMSPPPELAVEDSTGDIDLLASGSAKVKVDSPYGCPIVSSSFAETLKNGVATFSSIAIDQACRGYWLRYDGSLANGDSAPFDIVVGAAAGLALDTAIDIPVRRVPFSLAVRVVDLGGNTVTSAPATMVTLSLPSGVSFSGPTTLTTTNGVGTFANLIIDATGNVTATASAPGLTPAYYSLVLSAWEQRSVIPYGYNTNLYVDPTNPDTVYETGTIFARSVDGARTFSQLAPMSAVDLAFNPRTPTTIYVATSSDVQVSTDGVTFNSVGLRTDSYNAVAVDPAAPSTVWAVADRDVWRSADSGASWTNVTPADATTLSGIAIDPNGVVYLGGDRVRRSADGGASWTSGMNPFFTVSFDPFDEITFDPLEPSRIYACLTNGGCYASSDSGSTWTDMGISGVRLVVDPSGSGIVYLLGSDGSISKSRDRGATWTQIVSEASYELALAPSNPQELYARFSDGIYRTLSGGE